MVSYSSLLLVILVVVTLIGAAGVILARWIQRWLYQRRASRLESELRALSEQLRMPTALQTWRDRLLFGLGSLALLCVVWGFVEPNWLEVTEHHIVSPKLRATSSIRIVHLSDIHSDAKAHAESALIKRVEELKPDLILFTGDAINEEAGLSVFRATVTALARIAPTYTVRGNWETWWFPNLDLYGKTNAVPLDGRAEAVDIRGQRLWLVGVGVDRETQLRSAMARVPAGSFSLLLHHFPALAPAASKLGVDVMLAGDTHGGQARLPGLGEIVRIKRRGFWRSSGLHREGSLWLYVTRGIGVEGGVPRFRFACRPEISVLVFEGQH